MKFLIFTKTGKRHDLNCDITIFSDRIRILPDKYETIVLDEIQHKHCAIFKDDQLYKIIDFCTFDTKLFTKDDIKPKLLKPLTFYELRNSDTIIIGEHEIVFHSKPDPNDKTSFYVPETQEIEHDFSIQNTVYEDVEIPETQELTPEIDIAKLDKISLEIKKDQKIKSIFLEPETVKSLKEAVNPTRNEYLIDTQPYIPVVKCTRRYAAKQNEIKPKTVPLSVFDCDTQALNTETQAITFSQIMKENKSKKMTRKRKSEPPKVAKNSVLLSSTESDSDDDRSSRISAVSVKYANRSPSPTENTLSQISINDDIMVNIESTEFDSQFIAQVNSSCEIENTNQINSEIIKEEIKLESDSNLTKKESDDYIKPRKRIKLFKYASSDEE